MGESISHIRLVNRILVWVRLEHGDCRHLCILSDLPDSRSSEKPPLIGGFLPDVFVEDAPPTFTVIGEAKTAQDLEREHTKRQFRGYLLYLKLRLRPCLIVSTPWFVANSAKSLIAAAQREVEAASVAVRIIHC
jgi:hypothetical protein